MLEPLDVDRQDVPRVISAKEVAAMLLEDIRRRPEFGLRKAIVNFVLEPANPFEPQAVRPPKRWFVLFAMLMLLAGGSFVYFDVLH